MNEVMEVMTEAMRGGWEGLRVFTIFAITIIVIVLIVTQLARCLFWGHLYLGNP